MWWTGNQYQACKVGNDEWAETVHAGLEEIYKKLQEYFGEKIVIITLDNRNVVTFRSTVGTITSEQPKYTTMR